MPEYTQRLSIPIKPDAKERFLESVPEGTRAAFLRSVLEIALDAVDKGGPKMLGVILNGPEYVRLAARPEPKG